MLACTLSPLLRPSGLRELQLSVNYRSTRTVVAFLNAVILRNHVSDYRRELLQAAADGVSAQSDEQGALGAPLIPEHLVQARMLYRLVRTLCIVASDR